MQRLPQQQTAREQASHLEKEHCIACSMAAYQRSVATLGFTVQAGTQRGALAVAEMLTCKLRGESVAALE